MTTVNIDIELPDTTTKDEAKLLLALKMYEVGKISLGQAARIAGYSKRAFLEILDHYKIPVFNYSADDLREEIGL
jgi:predicted HTH domain antitoxin